jgi:hypothetical protein
MLAFLIGWILPVPVKNNSAGMFREFRIGLLLSMLAVLIISVQMYHN